MGTVSNLGAVVIRPVVILLVASESPDPTRGRNDPVDC